MHGFMCICVHMSILSTLFHIILRLHLHSVCLFVTVFFPEIYPGRKELSVADFAWSLMHAKNTNCVLSSTGYAFMCMCDCITTL